MPPDDSAARRTQAVNVVSLISLIYVLQHVRQQVPASSEDLPSLVSERVALRVAVPMEFDQPAIGQFPTEIEQMALGDLDMVADFAQEFHPERW